MTYQKIVLLVFTLLLQVSVYAKTQAEKVVVVGAGIAGLTTAYRLHQKNIDIEIYEARQCVGGRILSAVVDGCVVELGGQSITDASDAPNMKKLIAECG